jgi:shikimate dehydrogenase
LIDADTQIIQYAGKSIPDLFAEGGEELFRSIESQVLRTIGKRSGCVIATGGGCVTRPENYPILHQNGTIVWICRDLQALPVDGRPLSQKGSLQEMYNIRKPMYQQFADHIVCNHATPQETADSIITILAGGA